VMVSKGSARLRIMPLMTEAPQGAKG